MEDIKLIRIDRNKVREEKYYTLAEAREIIRREKIEEIKETAILCLASIGFTIALFLYYIFLY